LTYVKTGDVLLYLMYALTMNKDYWQNSLDMLELILTTRNGGKIIGASLDGDAKRRLGKKLSKLKQKNYIHKKDGIWEVTDQGKEYYSAKNNFIYFKSTFSEHTSKEYLVIFDIPESERRKRNYIRYQLQKYHYEQLQRSVWYGPGPLPKEFLLHLEKINVRKNILIFKAGKIL